MRRWYLVLVVVLAGCVSAIPVADDPVRIFYARPLIAETWYEDLFHRMEKCLGKSRPYSAINWFLVQPGMIRDGASEGAGLWSSPANIYLDSRFALSEFVLIHEMAHYLMDEGDSAHENPLFVMCTRV